MAGGTEGPSSSLYLTEMTLNGNSRMSLVVADCTAQVESGLQRGGFPVPAQATEGHSHPHSPTLSSAHRPQSAGCPLSRLRGTWEVSACVRRIQIEPTGHYTQQTSSADSHLSGALTRLWADTGHQPVVLGEVGREEAPAEAVGKAAPRPAVAPTARTPGQRTPCTEPALRPLSVPVS